MIHALFTAVPVTVTGILFSAAALLKLFLLGGSHG